MKTCLAYIAIGLLKLLGYMPLAWAQALGRVIGGLLYARRTRLREVTRVNLALTYPHFNAQRIDDRVEKTLLQTGMSMSESACLWGRDAKNTLSLVKHVEGEVLLDDALNSKTGLLFCVPHQGNWEVMNGYLASKTPMLAMYRPPKNPAFDRWLLKSRLKTGAEFVPTTRDGVLALFDRLKNNGVVGFLPDQEPKPQNGCFAPFMGYPTLTPNLPHQLIQDSGCRVLFGYAHRLEGGQGFDVHIIEPDAGIYSPDAVTCATALNRAVEQCLEGAPDQYCWTYKRFKRTQDGAMDPYTKADVP